MAVLQQLLAASVKEAQKGQVKFMKISETLDEVERDLRDEEELLLKLKEVVMKETRVLKVRKAIPASLSF